MPTYFMIIEYDGTGFSGWQVQPEEPTVQQAVEDALVTALRTRIAVVASGRTDAGVHARMQVAHFRADEPVDEYRLLASVNGLLPRSVAIRSLGRAPDGFHARYDARLRTYHYYVTTGYRALDLHMRLRIRPATDFDRMNASAKDLIGRQDFTTFCQSQSATRSRTCEVHAAEWVRESDDGDWRFEISANRFVHGMVRSIVGTLLEIGSGRRPSDDVRRILGLGDRRAAGPAVPALGLVLERVHYEADVEEHFAGHDLATT